MQIPYRYKFQISQNLPYDDFVDDEQVRSSVVLIIQSINDLRPQPEAPRQNFPAKSCLGMAELRNSCWLWRRDPVLLRGQSS
eukprot:scaffold63210_cov32-Prasinocladus_malaysianus.AAC.1